MFSLRPRNSTAGLLDQAVSAATNFLSVSTMAHLLGPVDFGLAGLGGIIFLFGVRLSRSIVGEPLLTSSRSEHRHSVAAASLVGGGYGMIVLCAAVSLDGSMRTVLLAVAVSMPGACIQDAQRYALFHQGRAYRALLSDVVWLATSAAGLGILVSTGIDNLGLIFLAWPIGASIAAAANPELCRALHRPGRALTEFRSDWRRSMPYLAESLLAMTTVNLALVLVPRVHSIEAVGQIRATQALFGPVGIVFAGLYPVVLPDAARQYLGRGHHALRQTAIRTSFFLLAVTMVWALTIYLLPESLGHMLLGSSWQAASVLAPWMALGLSASAIGGGATVGLKALDRQFTLSMLRLSYAPLAIAAPTYLIATTDSAAGFFQGWAIGQAALFASAWYVLVRLGRSSTSGVLTSNLQRDSYSDVRVRSMTQHDIHRYSPPVGQKGTETP